MGLLFGMLQQKKNHAWLLMLWFKNIFFLTVHKRAKSYPVYMRDNPCTGMNAHSMYMYAHS